MRFSAFDIDAFARVFCIKRILFFLRISYQNLSESNHMFYADAYAFLAVDSVLFASYTCGIKAGG